MDGNVIRLVLVWCMSGCAGLGAYFLFSGALTHYGCNALDTVRDVLGMVMGAFVFALNLGFCCRALDVLAHEQSDARIREFLRYRR